MIGGFIVDGWNDAYPGGGPFGLVGWQAAFMAVGIPGLLLAAWVATLSEPVRGLVDGVPTQVSPTPFKGFFEDLYAIIPPFTLMSAMLLGGRALAITVGAAVQLVPVAPVQIESVEGRGGTVGGRC